MPATIRQERALKLPFPEASVGRKLLVSLSGLFLIVFLVVHLGVNLTLYLGRDAYNTAAHWMATDPAILAMRPVLAFGAVLHIAVSVWLWVGNLKARPQRYETVDRAGGSTWAARNMIILGALILVFLLLHVSTFSLRLAYGSPPMTELEGRVVKDAYALVTGSFAVGWYAATYFVGIVLLGFHLSHGLQSSLQTMGLSDARWRGRWTLFGNLYAVIVAAGFASLPLYFFVQAQLGSTP
jgi:succinate dehydrogenase / fumarate reductase, cytochrome b subunit